MDMNSYLVEHSTGNLYMKDRQGKYLGCNKVFADLLGLPSPEAIIGKTDRDLALDSLGEDKIQALVEIDQLVMNTGQPQVLEEIGIDEEKNLAIYITKKVPLRNDKGEIIGLIGTSINITRQKQAEMADVAKTEFISNMCHDIRTPFFGIRTIATSLQKSEKNKAKKKALDCLVESVNFYSAFLEQYIEIAKLGNKPLQNTNFNISDMLEELKSLMSAEIHRKNLSVIISCACSNHKIRADKFRLTKIVLNLFANAIKFTPSGTIEINCVTEPRLKISVKDTGIGIPEDKLVWIFEKFSKLSISGNNTGFSGLGIGLYLSKYLANEMGGDITVKSTLGQGSEFTFSL